MTGADARERLERQRAELARELLAAEGALVELRSARGDADGDDEHDPEGPTVSAQWSHARGIADSLRGRLEETDAAVDRIEHGVYGTCVRCGRPIAPGRLDARPSAELCIDCASLGT